MKEAQPSINNDLRRKTLVNKRGFKSQEEAEKAYLIHKKQMQDQINQLDLLNKSQSNERLL